MQIKTFHIQYLIRFLKFPKYLLYYQRYNKEGFLRILLKKIIVTFFVINIYKKKNPPMMLSPKRLSLLIL